MKRRPPLWLLRDITATAAMLASLWALTWTMFAIAFTAQRRKRGSTPSERQLVYELLARAEEALDNLIKRQAYRLLGFSTRAIERVAYDPATDLTTFSARFARYMRSYEYIDTVARAVADEMRRSLNISKAEAEVIRTRAPRTGACLPLSPRDCANHVLSRRNAAKAEGRLMLRTNARGPPARHQFRKSATQLPQRASA